MTQHRRERLSKEISRGVAEILRTEVSDPRMGFVSIMGTRISRDYKHARVFASVMGDEKKKKLTMAALHHAAGFVRTALASRLGLRECPTIEFSLDDTIDKAMAVTKILDQIKPTLGASEEE